MKRIISALLISVLVILALIGCTPSDVVIPTSDPQASYSTGEPVQPSDEIDTDTMFTDRDSETDYNENESVLITLSGDTATSTSPAKASVSGNIVTILSAGTYIISGTLADGSVTVDAGSEDKIQIVLENACITSSSEAPVYIKQADKVFITLADGSENTLSNTVTITPDGDTNTDGVIFSKDDLTLNGNGKLTISSCGHGIVSKDDLAVTGGTYVITAASHGIAGKDSVRISGGSFEITSGKDCIHAENSDDISLGYVYIADGSFSLTAEEDGISAAATLQTDGGSFTIKTGGGSGNAQSSGGYPWSVASDTESAKGIKAGGDLIINGGTFSVDSSDDAIHSNSSVYINECTAQLSSGDDGIHADAQTAINAGTVSIIKSYEGIEGNSITVTGGNIYVVSSDDGFNAAGGNDGSGFARPGDAFVSGSDSFIRISGGYIVVNASGDGIDSNGALYVEGGETYVSGPTDNGNGALDYASTATVSGGIFVATGSSGMAQNFGNQSTQGAALVNLSSNQSAGTVVTLKDASGNVLAEFETYKKYNSVLVSAPGMVSGGTYKLTAGTYSADISMTGLIYGSGSGGFGGGGFGGGDFGGFGGGGWR